ncbi:hypothetical protein TNCT_446011 [Trichonephila clavata]|uniref:Uncharacterized protein n=1 Tax=Trichonephila clavata TaxID=2740835 RepID=A0A8X6ISQ6_TRICU|nr:hypothetical protein TNCT_446011 [Trichonephila clavata]
MIDDELCNFSMEKRKSRYNSLIGTRRVERVPAHNAYLSTAMLHPSTRGGAFPGNKQIAYFEAGCIHLWALLQNANHSETNCHYITALLIKPGAICENFPSDSRRNAWSLPKCSGWTIYLPSRRGVGR